MAAVYVLHIGVLWLLVSRRHGRSPLEIVRLVAVPAVSSSSAVLIGYLVYLTIDGGLGYLALLCSIAVPFAVMMLILARDSIYETVRHVRMAFRPD